MRTFASTKYFRRTFLSLLPVIFSWVLPALAVPWLPFGPDGGDARRFAADPHDRDHLYLGTANGWLYESHNGGGSWKRVVLMGKRDDLILENIVVDPTDSKHIVIGAYSVDRPDGGLYITYDGGATWISQAEMRGQSIRSLTIAPSDPQVWVAGTLKGVFRSTDGARRWKLISPPDSTEIHEVESVAIDPADPNTIYAGTWHLPWKTTDAGLTWTNIKNGIIDDSDVFSIIIDPVAPKIVYASACSGIYKSLNAGAEFVKVQGIPSEARRTRVLLQDPAHLSTVFAGTTEGLFRSDDAGKTWKRTTAADVIVNDVSIQAGDSKHVLIATDRGGVLSSDDGGDTFHSSNSGFSTRQITSMRRDAAHPATLFVGVVYDKQWGGVFESDNGGVNWTQRSDGLAGRDVFSLGQAPDGTILAGTAHGMFRLDSSAEAWNRVEDAPRASAADHAVTASLPPAVVTRPPATLVRNQFAKAQGQHGVLHEAGPKTLRGGARPVPASGRLLRGKAAPPVRRRTASSTGKAAATHRKPAVTVRRKSSTLRVQAGKVPGRPVAKPAVSLAPRPLASSAPTPASASGPASASFDGSVFSFATAGSTVLATTSEGLLASTDNGVSWQRAGPSGTVDWRLLASAGNRVVASSLYGYFLSADDGATWKQVPLPEGFTRVFALAVEPGGNLWVGGREGVYVSADAGETWTTPKNLYVASTNSIFFDQPANRILITADGPSDLVFSVQLPERTVTYTRSGWDMRFVRPVGDHLVAVTPYNGVVIQPKMMPTPVQAAATAAR